MAPVPGRMPMAVPMKINDSHDRAPKQLRITQGVLQRRLDVLRDGPRSCRLGYQAKRFSHAKKPDGRRNFRNADRQLWQSRM